MAVEISRAIEEIARSQHGLVTSAQAVAALGPGRKARWVRSGKLTSVQPQVLRVAGAPTTWHQALMAAALATGGVVSHRSAAQLWGLIDPAGYVEVSVSVPHDRGLRPPAIAHRVERLHPRLAARREGLDVTDPVRTVIDLGHVLPRPAVTEALARGLGMGLFSAAEAERLRAALARQGGDPAAGVRRQLDGPARSSTSAGA